MNIDQTIDLFKLYGYHLEEQSDDCLVFSLNQGMYPVVQIVPLPSCCENTIAKVKQNYNESGYNGVYVCDSDSLSNLEGYLFNGFFHVETSNARIANRYQEYVNSVMKPYSYGEDDADTLINKYRFMNVDYILEEDFIEKDNYENIVDSIHNRLNASGAKLIIVEAAAGFGKTSTAYELLNKYVGISKDVRPFFMELAKERTASNFRYAMLSQIDQTFDQNIKNDIVIYNIKKGRIPLIIDGFDELLSKDLDKGCSVSTAFKSVETMLSTIADLLTENTKIVLTTRKTAIFSGESFIEWYDMQKAHGRNFIVSRYQLNAPKPSDWIDENRMRLIPFEVNSVRNPVLLSYLKYVDEEKLKEITGPNQIIDRFFTFMMQREMSRQEIPFNKNEQFSIFRKLAIYFAGFDMTADRRSEVKNTIYETSQPLIKGYSTIEKDEEALTNALTNHALLDRKKNGNVGFLNDFIYGYMLADALLNEDSVYYKDYYAEFSYSSIIKMIESMSLKDRQDRLTFYEKLMETFALSNELQFWSDILLKKSASHNYHDLAFSNTMLDNVSFDRDDFSFSKCAFSNMTFKESIFNFERFSDCSFVNCHFENCIYDSADSSFLFNCTGIEIEKTNTESIVEDNDSTVECIDKQILSSFLQVDKKTRKMRKISSLRNCFCDCRDFKKLFDSLVSHKYIVTNGDKAFITDEGINRLATL